MEIITRGARTYRHHTREHEEPPHLKCVMRLNTVIYVLTVRYRKRKAQHSVAFFYLHRRGVDVGGQLVEPCAHV